MRIKTLLSTVILLFGCLTLQAQNAELSFDSQDSKTSEIQESPNSRASKITFIDEDFEGGSLPTGWSVQNGGSSWVISSDNSNAYWTIPAHTTYASILDVYEPGFDDRDNPDTYIATSSIDFTGISSARLSFDCFYEAEFAGHWRVKLSTDGGTSWSEIRYLEDTADVWQSELIDISSYINNEPDVKIAFHFSDTSDNNPTSQATAGFAIDDVQVFEPSNNDLGVESIEPTFAVEGSSVTPTVALYNYGTEDESTWSVTLTDGVSYNETVSDLATINSDTEYIASFPDWSPTEGTYTLEAIVTLTGDSDATNDTLRTTANVVQPFSPNALAGNGQSGNYYEITLSDGSLTSVGSMPTNPINMGEEYAADTTIYRINYIAELYSVNPLNGNTTLLTTLSGLSGGIPVGIAYDWDNDLMYIASTDGSTTNYLYTVNLDTYALTLIGSDNALISGMDFANDGNLYATDLSDNLVQISTADGSVTTVGPIGHNASIYHDLSFDRTNNLLLTIDQTPDGTKYGYYDLSTGAFTEIASLGGTWDDITFTHYDKPSAITFSVTDGSNPLSGATVSIFGKELTTDGSGEATTNLLDGDYNYTVNLAGYDQATGSVNVSGSNQTVIVVLNETTYTVTFTVTDGTDPLQGAAIAIDGYSDIVTNASGQATIDLPNDNYDYTVTLPGYDDYTGSFTVADGPETVDVAMTETLYTVTFTVTDGSNPLENATISIPGYSDLTTNASGVATIDLTQGTYDYTVSLAGYNDVFGSFNISSSNVDVDVTMGETTYTATFFVNDGTDPLEGATVTVEGYPDLTTNVSGIATIDLPNGSYDYTVSLAGYDTVTGSFTVADGPESIDVVMSETTYTATFSVTDGSNPLQGATVSIDGESDITTDASGIATIELTNGTYDYTVSLANYDTVTGSFTIADATETVDVVMTLSIYTATFTVTDGANPLLGATVSITGESDLTTDASGIATIDLPNGTYDYSVSLDGYDTVTGSFTVADGPESIDVTMSETTYTATFSVTDGSNPLQGATVSIDGESDITTDASGIATIDLPNGTYDYTVSLANYDTVTGSFTITDATETVDVVMTLSIYTATFTVTDGANPLLGATVSITGESDLTTDASGIATIDLPNGTYDYSVSLDGYDTVTGTFAIADTPESIDVVMSQSIYTATFTITDGSDPLEGATISIDGQSDITTNASGAATIDLPNGTYDYTVSLSGYNDSIGSFTIADANLAIDIILDDVGIYDINANGFLVYPNPTRGIFYIETSKLQTITVLNAIGKVITSKKVNGKETMDLTGRSPGIYLLRLKSGDKVITQRIILQ